MAIAYFDASAFVKLVVDEEGSDLAAMIWDRCDAAVASRLVIVEVCAALSAAARNNTLAERRRSAATALALEFWTGVRVIELSSAVAASASLLAHHHSLKGADAVHLASALTVGGSDLVMATWDRRLAMATRAESTSVVPTF